MQNLNMVYWQDEDMWIGKLLEYPNLMTQGETLEELEENILDLYKELILHGVPEHHGVKELRV
ncbi:MAG: type II toxin-antitoxin system HicB family antitoxin [Pleurocapsa sp. SU_196_0]|nr:type II toxin-antitoxin system HicB family antitoxin [Pleurocapsa sp. SU_196_0]